MNIERNITNNSLERIVTYIQIITYYIVHIYIYIGVISLVYIIVPYTYVIYSIPGCVFCESYGTDDKLV